MNFPLAEERFFYLIRQVCLRSTKKIVKATLTNLEYEEMKTKLGNVLGSGSSCSAGVEEMRIKVEDINLGEEELEEQEKDVLYGLRSNFPQRGMFRKSASSRGGFYNRSACSGNRENNYYVSSQSQYG